MSQSKEPYDSKKMASAGRVEQPYNGVVSMGRRSPIPATTSTTTEATASPGELRKNRKRDGRSKSPKPSQPGAFKVRPDDSFAATLSSPSSIVSEKNRSVLNYNRSPMSRRIPKSRSPRNVKGGNSSSLSPHRSKLPAPGVYEASSSAVPSNSNSNIPDDGPMESKPSPAAALKKPPPPAGSTTTNSKMSPSDDKSDFTKAGANRLANRGHGQVQPQMAKQHPNFPDDGPVNMKQPPDMNNPNKNPPPVASAAAASSIAPAQPREGKDSVDIDGDYVYDNDQKKITASYASTGRVSVPGAERASWAGHSSKDMTDKSQQNLLKMAQSPSGAAILPSLEAVRVESAREMASESNNLAIATAEKDSCWAFLKRSQSAQIGIALGCLVVVGLIVALAAVFGSGASSSSPPEDPSTIQPEFFFFDQLGPHLDGTRRGGRFGSGLSINQDGTRLAVADSEDVYLYELDESADPTDWILIGTIPAPENATLGLLNGLDESDMVRSAVVVDISNDGRAVAIGWPYSANDEGLAPRTGRVEIYEEIGDQTWGQVGNTMYGRDSLDFFGAAIALGDNGDQVAVGAPGNGGDATVYTRVTQNFWATMGNPVELNGSLSVISIAFEGPIVALSGQPASPDDPVAHMFRYVDGDFFELGFGIFGKSADNTANTAYFVDMSADGTIVAVSNLYTEPWEGELNDALDVRVFEWDGTSKWNQLGENLHALAPGEKSGYFFSLDNTGMLMAMGDPGRRSEDGGGVSGHIHIYKYKPEDNVWKQIGPNRDGDAPGDQFGYAVCISGDGQHVVASAPFNRGEGIEVGRVYAFDLADMDKVATQEGWGGG